MVAAWLVNAVTLAILATHAAKADILIVHGCTDYVFDGAKPTFYLETDPVGPVGVYGASKEGGKYAIRTGTARRAIVRTSRVVSPHDNFNKTMLCVGSQSPLLKVVDDKCGAPTVVAGLSRAFQVITLRKMSGDVAPSGTFHYCNTGETKWCRLAREIFAVVAENGQPILEVDAISTLDYPTPARRPANSRLSTSRVVERYGVGCPPWQSSVRTLVNTLLTQNPSTEPART